MRIDARTVFIPILPDGSVLLLKRGAYKKILPGLITGIGGKVELAQGEGEDLEAAGRREWAEEMPQLKSSLEDVRLRLVTHDTRGKDVVLLLWFTVRLTSVPDDLSCNEGEVIRFPLSDLPLDSMTPTAKHAIPFVLSLANDDQTIYDGVFTAGQANLVLSHVNP